MKLLLKNAQVIDPPSSFHGKRVDILIVNGIIQEVGTGLSAKKVYDLNGKVVTPGFCDLFANFCEPGFEHREDLISGSQAAISSGFTDVCLIPNTFPVTETKSDVSFLRSRSNSGLDIHVIGALSEGCLGENLTEILDLHDAGAIAFSDGLSPTWNAELLLKALQYVQKFDGLIISRPKDIHLSQFSHMHEGPTSTVLGLKGEPSLSEEIAIKRNLDVLKYTGGRLHFTHISTAKGVDLIRVAKRSGLSVTCDVAIHQLIYTDEDLLEYESNLKVDPPFRSERDRKALLKGVKEGVIDGIVSSHQPLDSESKELEFDLATPGICSLPTLYSDLIGLQDQISIDELIPKLTSGPRGILGLESVTIEEGSPAKLAVFDPEMIWNFDQKHNPSKSINSPAFGKAMRGRCYAVINSSFVRIE